jgi:hypothetical protein
MWCGYFVIWRRLGLFRMLMMIGEDEGDVVFFFMKLFLFISMKDLCWEAHQSVLKPKAKRDTILALFLFCLRIMHFRCMHSALPLLICTTRMSHGFELIYVVSSFAKWENLLCEIFCNMWGTFFFFALGNEAISFVWWLIVLVLLETKVG